LSYCSDMASVIVMQGRRLDESDMGLIRGLLDANPGWNGKELKREAFNMAKRFRENGTPSTIGFECSRQVLP